MISIQDIKELSQNLQEPSWVLDFRLKNFDLISSELEKSSDEFLERDYSFAGVDLFCDGARVIPFSNALKDPGLLKLIKKNFEKLNLKYTTLKSGLVRAGFTDGFVVVLDKPEIKYLELFLAQIPENSMTYIFIIIKEGLDLTLLETLDSRKSHLIVYDIVLESNSKIQYISTQKVDESSDLNLFRNIEVGTDSSFDFFFIHTGSLNLIDEVNMNLLGHGGTGSINGIYLAKNNQKYEIVTRSIHQNSKTNSDIFVKGLIDDFAFVKYKGLVRMEAGVKDTQGYQKEDALMLSPKARIEAIPDLEINANEVKCSHGVSISRINKDNIFYLQSKGLSETESQRLIKIGHLVPALSKIKNELVKEDLVNLIQDIINPELQEDLI